MAKRAVQRFLDSLAAGLAKHEPAERERIIKAGDALLATRRALLAKPPRRVAARAGTRGRGRAAS